MCTNAKPQLKETNSQRKSTSKANRNDSAKKTKAGISKSSKSKSKSIARVTKHKTAKAMKHDAVGATKSKSDTAKAMKSNTARAMKSDAALVTKSDTARTTKPDTANPSTGDVVVKSNDRRRTEKYRGEPVFLKLKLKPDTNARTKAASNRRSDKTSGAQPKGSVTSKAMGKRMPIYISDSESDESEIVVYRRRSAERRSREVSKSTTPTEDVFGVHRDSREKAKTDRAAKRANHQGKSFRTVRGKSKANVADPMETDDESDAGCGSGSGIIVEGLNDGKCIPCKSKRSSAPIEDVFEVYKDSRRSASKKSLGPPKSRPSGKLSRNSSGSSGKKKSKRAASNVMITEEILDGEDRDGNPIVPSKEETLFISPRGKTGSRRKAEEAPTNRGRRRGISKASDTRLDARDIRNKKSKANNPQGRRHISEDPQGSVDKAPKACGAPNCRGRLTSRRDTKSTPGASQAKTQGDDNRHSVLNKDQSPTVKDKIATARLRLKLSTTLKSSLDEKPDPVKAFLKRPSGPTLNDAERRRIEEWKRASKPPVPPKRVDPTQYQDASAFDIPIPRLSKPEGGAGVSDVEPKNTKQSEPANQGNSRGTRFQPTKEPVNNNRVGNGQRRPPIPRSRPVFRQGAAPGCAPQLLPPHAYRRPLTGTVDEAPRSRQLPHPSVFQPTIAKYEQDRMNRRPPMARKPEDVQMADYDSDISEAWSRVSDTPSVGSDYEVPPIHLDGKKNIEAMKAKIAKNKRRAEREAKREAKREAEDKSAQEENPYYRALMKPSPAGKPKAGGKPVPTGQDRIATIPRSKSLPGMPRSRPSTTLPQPKPAPHPERVPGDGHTRKPTLGLGLRSGRPASQQVVPATSSAQQSKITQVVPRSSQPLQTGVQRPAIQSKPGPNAFQYRRRRFANTGNAPDFAHDMVDEERVYKHDREPLPSRSRPSELPNSQRGGLKRPREEHYRPHHEEDRWRRETQPARREPLRQESQQPTWGPQPQRSESQQRVESHLPLEILKDNVQQLAKPVQAQFKSHPSHGELPPPRRESRPSRPEARPTQGEAQPPRRASYPPRGESYPTRGDTYPPTGVAYQRGETLQLRGVGQQPQGGSQQQREVSQPPRGMSQQPTGGSYPPRGEAHPLRREVEELRRRPEETRSKLHPPRGELPQSQVDREPPRGKPWPSRGEAQAPRPEPRPSREEVQPARRETQPFRRELQPARWEYQQPRRESLPPRRDLQPSRRESQSLRHEAPMPRRDVQPLRRELPPIRWEQSARRESYPPRREAHPRWMDKRPPPYEPPMHRYAPPQGGARPYVEPPYSSSSMRGNRGPPRMSHDYDYEYGRGQQSSRYAHDVGPIDRGRGGGRGHERTPVKRPRLEESDRR